MKKENDIAIMIMAAGTSSRMKSIKQLLPWGKTTLLGNALKNAQKSNASKIGVVLGAYAGEIRKEMDFNGVECVYNEGWKSGLGSSIGYGTRYILENKKEYKGILLMLADQPFIDHVYLNTMIQDFLNSPYTIVATQYKNGIGVPAIFGNTHFEYLSRLDSSFGAKDIIKTHRDHVLSISPNGKEIDIDTMEEYERVIGLL